jgi:hypothetical protein
VTGTALIFLKPAGIEYSGADPSPQGGDQKVKRVITAMLMGGLIIAGACPARAGGKGVRVYNRNYEYEMKVEGNRVLDKNYRTKYRLEGNRIYDEDYRYQGKIEGNKIYDRNYRYQGTIEGGKVYDRNYRLKYYLEK